MLYLSKSAMPGQRAGRLGASSCLDKRRRRRHFLLLKFRIRDIFEFTEHRAFAICVGAMQPGGLRRIHLMFNMGIQRKDIALKLWQPDIRLPFLFRFHQALHTVSVECQKRA